MRLPKIVLLAAAALVLLSGSQSADASTSIRYGIQDDAWLAFGPGTLAERAERLHDLGVSVVRYTLQWNEIAESRPDEPRSAADPAYDWSRSDAVLKALRAEGIEAVVGLSGTPSWANGDKPANVAPKRKTDFAAFAYAAAKRYRWVRDWLVWNEPNQRRWLLPASPRVYVQTLLNPAYAAIHQANRRAVVAGGVTAPRGGPGGVSPVQFIRGMSAAGARLDVYAHHPYPLRPRETPWTGGCDHCETITMATLGRLLTEVYRAFGPKHIWLTEYAYQTNPPDRTLGVSFATQARFIAEASLRTYLAPRVDMLIHYLVQDEPDVERWQSGLQTVTGRAKPAMRAFEFPFAQVSRSGSRSVVWGQVRPGSGARAYRLQIFRGARWSWLGASARTNSHGFFRVTIDGRRGTKLRAWAPSLGFYSRVVVIR